MNLFSYLTQSFSNVLDLSISFIFQNYSLNWNYLMDFGLTCDLPNNGIVRSDVINRDFNFYSIDIDVKSGECYSRVFLSRRHFSKEIGK